MSVEYTFFFYKKHIYEAVRRLKIVDETRNCEGSERVNFLENV